MYREYLPGNCLSPYIDKYWELEGYPEYGMRMSILPDGCTDVIFTLDEAVNPEKGGLLMQPYRSYFIGPMSTYSELVAYARRVHMFGIRFRPCGIFRFMELPVSELRDQRLEMNEAGMVFDVFFAERLDEEPDVKRRIDFTERFLLNILRTTNRSAEGRITHAVRKINLYGGKLTIRELSGELCLCQRQLERQFKWYTGFSPKEYSRIIKFRNAVRLLRTVDSGDLLSVAMEAGYYDIPHLSREIKRLSGNTPYSFLSFFPEKSSHL